MGVKYNNYYGIKNWNVHFTVPTFDFYFKFEIPEPKKERIIIERDAYGRIIHSRLSETVAS
ncbi:MAG: hypothetical protein ABIJ05_03280 [Patescibacteria group bacterium]